MRAGRAAVLFLTLAGCSSPPSPDAGSPAGSDASAPDSGPIDSGPGDSGRAGGDAGQVLDAGQLDAGARVSPIALENAKPGDTGWHLSYPSAPIAYTDATSYAPGGVVHVHAAAPTATTAQWQLWRLGYYGGTQGRLVASGGPVALEQAPAPVMDPQTGAVRAPYPDAFSIPLDPSAVTGLYLLKVQAPAAESYVPIVVREATPLAPILVVLPVNTYQAYNYWGGTSLYTNSRTDWPAWHAFAASFDRPYVTENGAGEVFQQDSSLITFAEGQGYDIAYATDQDLDADPHLTVGRRMVVVSGHSEYWSAAMWNQIDGAIAAGVNVAFLGANDMYWQVRYAPGATGDARRTLIAYKDFAAQDPYQKTNPALVTTLWRNPPVGRPENAILGEMFGAWIRDAAPLIVGDATLWPWTGANVTTGTVIPGVYGDEVDSRFTNGLEPSGLQVIGSGVSEDYAAHLPGGQTTLYRASSGAWVFDAGSITWARLLAAEGSWDARIQQFVANLFSKMAGSGVLGPSVLAPLTLPGGSPAPSYRPGVTVTTITSALVKPISLAFLPGGDAVVTDANRVVRVSSAGVITTIAGGGAAGYTDGPALQAQFSNPHGVAVASDGTLYVADTDNHVIRAIANGQVSTLAGLVQGFADGAGAAAQFDTPMGLVMCGTGNLLVADSWNQRIRSVSPRGGVTTVAGNGQNALADGVGTAASLTFPTELALMPDGSVVFTQPDTGLLRQLSPTGQVSTLMGELGREGWADGPVATASIFETLGVTARRDGTLVMVDSASARIRAVSSGQVATLAGGTGAAGVDGTGAQAGFSYPRAAAFAPDGSLWVVDAVGHSLRRIAF